MFSFRFKFLDPGPLVDGELSLIQPTSRYIDEVIEAEAISATYPADPTNPPGSVGMTPFDPIGARQRIEEFLSACPRGHQRADRMAGKVPAYHFWMKADRSGGGKGLTIVGGIGLRVGQNRELEFFSGHIGYHVYPPARGSHFAMRACRLLLPLCRMHKLSPVWITTNPDNIPSRKTCERLGARLVDTVAIPETHAFYARGETHKCRYRIDL